MKTIGTFTKNGNAYQGTVNTLALKAEISINPVKKKKTEKSPDYKVMAGQVEIGAAWNATSKKGNPYLSLKMEDPALPTYGMLIEGKSGFVLAYNP